MTSAILGERLRRIPDGETGARINWIGWQGDVLAHHPSFQMMPPDPNAYSLLPRFKLRSGVSTSDVVFRQLGYADAALTSYAVFSQLKQARVIPAHCRFQVSLPTPRAPVNAFIVDEDREIVQSAYETAMFAELDRIAAGIPHEELALQWDVALEFALLERAAFTNYAQVKAAIIEHRFH